MRSIAMSFVAARPMVLGCVLACSLAVTISVSALAAEPDGPAELVSKSEAVRISVQDQLGERTMKDAAAQIALAEYYSVPDRKLLWVDEAGINKRGKAVMAEIAKADNYGLRASDYDLPRSATLSGPTADSDKSAAVRGLADAELKISAAVVQYARDARGGRIEPQRLSKNLDPKLFLPDPAEVIGFIAIRSDPAAYLRSFQPNHPQFEALRKLLIAERGGEIKEAKRPEDIVIPSGPALKLGVEHGQVALLRKRLEVPAKEGANAYLFDDELRSVVMAFQQAQGGRPDGIVGPGTRRMLNGQSAPTVSGQDKIDLILANMERWRWLPQDLGPFYVKVNVPEFRLRVMNDGEQTYTTRVIVGKTRTQTPVFNDEMETIVFRPNWFVPQSIKANEIAPYLYRGGGFFGGGWDTSILRRQGLRIRGANGRDINPDSIDWSRADIRRYEVYQPPGPRNVLGLVKFLFPNSHDVYLHDTTQKHLFSKAVRAESHGCIRVQNPDQFATVLLQHDQNWTAERVNAAMFRGADANRITLNQHIPVYNTYFTAVVEDDGSLTRFRDLYGHDRRMVAALNGRPVPHGLPGSQAVTAQNERPIIRRSRRGGGHGDFNAITRSLFDF